jgi:hypothetical protein
MQAEMLYTNIKINFIFESLMGIYKILNARVTIG